MCLSPLSQVAEESSSAGAAVGVRPSPGQLGLAGCPEVSSGIDTADY